ncbi:MAG: phosphatase domain-containing protein [Chloroflexota bacterium]
MSIKQLIKQLAHRSDETIDSLRFKLRNRLGLDKPMHIIPFRGFGNESRAMIRGRVVRNKPYESGQADDSYLDNLIDVYGYITSQEVKEAKITATFLGQAVDLTTNSEGFFEHSFDINSIDQSKLDSIWQPVRYALESDDNFIYVSKSDVLLPSENARFGVISDIDDTVLQSKATNYLRAAQLMFLHNARTRLPFPGVSAFYQALHNEGENPIFYVSSSPWNLYPLLADFFEFQGLPAGPLFLMDYGFTKEQFITKEHREHKVENIQKILGTYSTLPFILIGDSGQKDAEIYREIAHSFREQIIAIYIRNVTDADRAAEVEKIGEEVVELGIPFIVSTSSNEMALDAKNRQFIPHLPSAEIERESDLTDYLEDYL